MTQVFAVRPFFSVKLVGVEPGAKPDLLPCNYGL